MAGKDLFFQETLKNMDETALFELVKEIRDDQKTLMSRQDIFEKDQDKILEDIEKLCKAFPDGDIEGHRRYHQTMMETLEEKRRLRRAIVEKTVAGLVWAGVVWAVAIGVSEFKDWIKLITGGHQ